LDSIAKIDQELDKIKHEMKKIEIANRKLNQSAKINKKIGHLKEKDTEEKEFKHNVLKISNLLKKKKQFERKKLHLIKKSRKT
jgi:hypothetical protein